MVRISTIIKNKPMSKTTPRPEREVQSAISEALDRLHIWHFIHHGGCRHCGMFGVKGISDIIGALPGSGRAFYIEVKKEGWKPPNKGTRAYDHYEHQQKFIVRAKAFGYALAGFATSIEEALEIIEVNEIV